jgi:hypothetical protein
MARMSKLAVTPPFFWWLMFRRTSAADRRRYKRMTTRERLFLPTWTKWRKYGRTPWKIIFHILLVLATTGQVKPSHTVVLPLPDGTSLLRLVVEQILVVNVQDSVPARNVNNAFYYFFFPGSYDFSQYARFLPAFFVAAVISRHSMGFATTW